jgi:hypothetical protein
MITQSENSSDKPASEKDFLLPHPHPLATCFQGLKNIKNSLTFPVDSASPQALHQWLKNHRPTLRGMVTLWGALLPSAIEATADGALSLSQFITCLFSLGILKISPEVAQLWVQPRVLVPLSLLPALAALNTFQVSRDEMEALIQEQWDQRDGKPKKPALHEPNANNIQVLNVFSAKKLSLWGWMRAKGEGFKELFINHPLHGVCVVIAGLAQGTIVFSNTGYLFNQFNRKISDSSGYYPILSLSSLIAAQFMILHGRHLIVLTQRGYTVPPYTRDKKDRTWLLQLLSILIVEASPILAALLLGALSASEAYELAQNILISLERGDIANRMAWLPAFIMGTLAAVCHLALYGLEFKEFLAHQVRRFNHANLLNEPYPATPAGMKFKRALLYTGAIGMLLAPYVISLAALDK